MKALECSIHIAGIAYIFQTSQSERNRCLYLKLRFVIFFFKNLEMNFLLIYRRGRLIWLALSYGGSRVNRFVLISWRGWLALISWRGWLVLISWRGWLVLIYIRERVNRFTLIEWRDLFFLIYGRGRKSRFVLMCWRESRRLLNGRVLLLIFNFILV